VVLRKKSVKNIRIANIRNIFVVLTLNYTFMKSIFLSFVLIFSFWSCKQSEADAEDNAVYASVVAPMKVKLPPKNNETSTNADGISATQSDAKIEQKIIKEGNLKFETNDLDATYNQILTAVKNTKATIQNDTQGKEYDQLFRTIIVRVPSQNFEIFVNSISKGVSYFERKEISAQDVTEQYIDLDARMKAKLKLEDRYLELLKKATKVSEMLEIEAQLSAIREEIEAKQGQLKYLQNRVSISTVTIAFYKTVAVKSGVNISYGAKIWNAIVSGFNGISEFFLGILSLWPFVVIIVTLFYFIRKRFKSKKI
jgi:hypothetical protein